MRSPRFYQDRSPYKSKKSKWIENKLKKKASLNQKLSKFLLKLLKELIMFKMVAQMMTGSILLHFISSLTGQSLEFMVRSQSRIKLQNLILNGTSSSNFLIPFHLKVEFVFMRFRPFLDLVITQLVEKVRTGTS